MKYYIFNKYGVLIAYNVAESMMDDELREELANLLAPCDNQIFYNAYSAAHEKKFGETWELNKENPCY